MKRKLRVGILFGGKSGEHEVSLASAHSALDALDKQKYEAVLIGVDKQGRWLAGPSATKVLDSGARNGAAEPSDAGKQDAPKHTALAAVEAHQLSRGQSPL